MDKNIKEEIATHINAIPTREFGDEIKKAISTILEMTPDELKKLEANLEKRLNEKIADEE